LEVDGMAATDCASQNYIHAVIASGLLSDC
jgi:hypothetical protein